ncbi:putative short chain dehydrogenase [metagenome]|uniref:Putative short chain dehydrogenase n=1 Tax=metagenome TaxID=256318 RepID=A0A2P2C0I7_9ZZZZ
MDIDGSVAIVTGAAGGIGSALAQRLLENGASVLVTDLDGVRVDATVASLRQYGADRITGLAGDCSVDATIQELIDHATRELGPVDIYIANAGVSSGQGLGATEAEWATSIEVNVLAHVRAARLLVPAWLERGRGYFVSTASAAGLLTQIGSPTYAVTKHAAVAFSEWLSVTYGSRGVRVSCLCPMGVNTPMLTAGTESADDDAARKAAQAVTEAGSVLEPLEVADEVVAAMEREQFLVLPHGEVLEFFRRKGLDYDRWLAGMRRYQDSLA